MNNLSVLVLGRGLAGSAKVCSLARPARTACQEVTVAERFAGIDGGASYL